jgi:uncharacterized membrane protein
MTSRVRSVVHRWRLLALVGAVASAAPSLAGPGSAPAAAETTAVAAEAPPAITLRGFLRDPRGGFTVVEPPGATTTKAGGINNRGEIVGGYYLDDLDEVNAGGGTQHGFLRDRRGRYTRIDVPGAGARSSAFDINDRGEIVGLYLGPDGTNHGFLRNTRGRFTTIDHPDATGSSPLGPGTNLTAITNGGELVGNYAAGGTVHGFVRDRRGRFTTIDRPGAAATYLTGINDRGQIVGISADRAEDLAAAPRGFLLERGRYRTIAVPSAAATTPSDINNRGQITGNYTDADGTLHGFVRDRRGRITTFDHPDAVPPGTAAYNINNRGQITGAYASTVDNMRAPRPASTRPNDEPPGPAADRAPRPASTTHRSQP